MVFLERFPAWIPGANRGLTVVDVKVSRAQGLNASGGMAADFAGFLHRPAAPAQLHTEPPRKPSPVSSTFLTDQDESPTLCSGSRRAICGPPGDLSQPGSFNTSFEPLNLPRFRSTKLKDTLCQSYRLFLFILCL